MTPTAPLAPPTSVPGSTTNQPPPVGTPPAVSTPPIIAPSPPLASVPPLPTASAPPATLSPQVESFDEHAHFCRPGETMKSICEKFGYPEKYETALLLYNRSHAMTPDGIRHDPPILQPGQIVYVPQLKILEKRYPSSIPGLTPVTPAAVVPVSGTQPPATGLPGQSGAISATARMYRVRVPGETFRQIAQHALNNPDRWSDIYQMNSRYDTLTPVPAGTVLQLPADARLEPGDVPPQQ